MKENHCCSPTIVSTLYRGLTAEWKDSFAVLGVRRNVRKMCGNIATRNILTQSGESLALFQNMSNPENVKIVFGSEDMPQH